ncbi:MAG: putative signaling protein [Fusobacteria bacterium]|nr:MAG: putative signaling protein [Fusobacteriota bacterium]KAF0230290.1 MAG: putative signaling [Fusobacteriota bacterium]
MTKYLTKNNILCAALCGVAFVMLYLAKSYNYLLFHAAVEMMSVVPSIMIFVIVLYLWKYLKDNNFISFIGISLFFVGVIDFLHMLAFKGMPIFVGFDSNLAVQLWILARYVQMVSFVIAAILINLARHVNKTKILIIYTLVVVVMLWSIFVSKIFPDAFIEGSGLTTFKVNSEYVIIIGLLLSGAIIWKKRESFRGNIVQLLLISILFQIFSELSFTTYISLNGFSNFLGHYLKVIWVVLLYGAILGPALESSRELLFKELAFQNKEKDKRAAELVLSNRELIFQKGEKADRAAELIIADKELAFQKEEKADRAAELVIANKELIYQNEEKDKRASELIVANKELAYQNGEKEKRAAELTIANKELAFQNEEREKRAEELRIAHIDLIQAYDTTIEGWSRGMDLRDKETEGHSLRVTEMTLRLAEKFGIDETDLVNIRRGALLHDMGKMGIPDSILLKPGKLTDEEWGIMRKHPQFAVDMLSHITYLKSAMDIPFSHHEKWDGSGYPQGLKEKQIPLAARIFAIVDVWDALRSDRPYREAWPEEKVIKHIKAGSGSHFDPEVVETFLNLINKVNLERKSH